MASILTHAIINSAKETVDTYITSVNGIYEELNGIISALTASNFNGDASDGYKVFYTQKVVPALTENLSAEQGSLMASLKEMLSGIEAQLLDTVDPQLGENNRNPGAEG